MIWKANKHVRVDFLKRNGSYFAYVPMVKSTGWLGGKLQI